MNNVAELSPEVCLELLARRSLGRIALVTEAGLRIFPVNYTVLEGAVVFRTLPYGVIASSAPDAEAAFEVDDIDERQRGGWSVVATGVCRRVERPEDVQAIRQEHDPEPWVEGRRNLYFRLAPRELTGRRVSGTGGATPQVPVPRGEADSGPVSAEDPSRRSASHRG